MKDQITKNFEAVAKSIQDLSRRLRRLEVSGAKTTLNDLSITGDLSVDGSAGIGVDLNVDGNIVVDGSVSFPGIEWSDYTPTWTGSTGNPTIGNGYVSGRYLTLGNMCHYSYRIYVGSTTTTATGIWYLSLPISANTTNSAWWSGIAWSNNAGVANYNHAVRIGGTDVITFIAYGASYVTDTVPFTFASGDSLQGNFLYEI